MGGLAGIVAADSAICTVGIEGRGLSYRGYSIEDLAARQQLRGGGLAAPARRPARPAGACRVPRAADELRRLPPELARLLSQIPRGDR